MYHQDYNSNEICLLFQLFTKHSLQNENEKGLSPSEEFWKMWITNNTFFSLLNFSEEKEHDEQVLQNLKKLIKASPVY